MIARVIHCGLCKCIHSGPRSRAAAPRKPYRRRWTQARMQQSQHFLATPLYCRLLELLFTLPLFRLCTAQLLCPAQVAWKALCLLSQHAAAIAPLPTPLNYFLEKRYANGWKKIYLHYRTRLQQKSRTCQPSQDSSEWMDAMLSTSDILILILIRTMCPVHNIWGAVCVFTQSNLREALLFLWLDIDFKIKNYGLWCTTFTCTP